MAATIETYYNSRTRVFWHIAFWVGFLLAHTLFYGGTRGAYAEEFSWALQNLPFKMAVTYFVLYVVIPRYLLQKKYLLAALVFAASVVAAALLQQLVNYTVIFPVFHPQWESAYLFYSSKMFNAVLGMYPVVTIAACIKLLRHWYLKESQAQELRRQKLEAELRFLKAQTHPHFLFNTLNNLYALTLKKSDRAPEVVLKLSGLLNYVLYECNEPTVPLAKELELVEHYISLEQIRYGDRLNVCYRVDGCTEGKEIPPMLILPFVENSFKHGASRQLEQAWVEVEVRVEGNELTLRVQNSAAPEVAPHPKENGREGIGLANVRRRLDLLYGGSYGLDISSEGDCFAVTLTLNLNHQPESEAA